MDVTTGTMGNVINLYQVFYFSGSSDVNGELSKLDVDNLVTLMGRFPKLRVELAGHTDNVGDAAANMTLSVDRSSKVKAYLVEKGVSADRLVAKGYGQDQPLDTNDTPEGRQKNRRTELRIISK